MIPDALGFFCLAQAAATSNNNGVSALTLGAFTLGGSLLAALAALGTTLINRRSEDRRHLATKEFEDRRHLREVAIKAAMQYWEKSGDWEFESAKIRGAKAHIAPPASYIIHMILVAELAANKALDSTNLADELRRIRAMTMTADQAAEREE